MATPDPVPPLEKEVVPLPDGRRLLLYRFPAGPARPEPRPADGRPPPPPGER